MGSPSLSGNGTAQLVEGISVLTASRDSEYALEVNGAGVFTSSIALVLMGVMGFGIGLSGPSRDMLIRSVTPHGATGRVYGVVYSGLDVGPAIAAALFGVMLDQGYFAEVFYGVAVCLLLSIVTVRVVTK